MSTTMLPQLPPEIIIEILARLPVKHLLRLKYVCKSWLSLISNNPQFAKLHLHYAKLDTSVNRYRLFLFSFPLQSIDHDAFCYGNNLVTTELNFPIVDVQPPILILSVIGTYNGLIAAFCHDKRFCVDTVPAKHIIVWNPSTGDFRELPVLDLPLHGESFYGFGYDSNLDDYKIVRGLVSTCGKKVQIEVLYLKASEWRRSSEDVHTSFSINNSLVHYSSSNGFVHWLVNLKNWSDKKRGIVSFDLAEEKFLEMVPVPDEITSKLSWLTVEGVADNLWVCEHAESPQGYFEAWMMKRDGSEVSWTKLYSFRAYPLLPIENHTLMEVIWVAKNGNVVLHVDYEQLLLYNPEERSSLEYGVNSDGQITYMETLVSPNAS